MMFKGLLVAKNCLIPESAPLVVDNDVQKEINCEINQKSLKYLLDPQKYKLYGIGAKERR